MVAVFVHGVPETAAVWDGVRSALGRDDTIALALPGFASELPAGFTPDKESYAHWLAGELAAIHAQTGPIDLVGHDWGSLLVQRVASLQPELLRSWAAGSGPVDSEYTWHETAQSWQTPELGEQVMAMMTPEILGVALVGELGPAAPEFASHIDDRMKACILTLYRSAVNVGAEWQSAVDALGSRVPALVLWGSDDSYAPVEFGRRLAARVGGRFEALPCGHFWPVLVPELAARHLESFWVSLP